MEFRRFEVRRVLRHREHVYEEDDVRGIFEGLRDADLSFTLQVHGLSAWKECRVLEVKEDGASIFSRERRAKDFAEYTEVLFIEVEANSDFVAEKDDLGRWAHLM